MGIVTILWFAFLLSAGAYYGLQYLRHHPPVGHIR